MQFSFVFIQTGDSRLGKLPFSIDEFDGLSRFCAGDLGQMMKLVLVQNNGGLSLKGLVEEIAVMGHSEFLGGHLSISPQRWVTTEGNNFFLCGFPSLW